jgi:hypothetical protein
MKRSFVQCAALHLAGADPAAPGGAVTVALCGTWDHAGACRWPHHTSAVWDDRRGMVRVVFVADAKEEDHVRALIDQALATGECVGPNGQLNRWQVRDQAAGVLSAAEKTLGARMAKSSSAE